METALWWVGVGLLACAVSVGFVLKRHGEKMTPHVRGKWASVAILLTCAATVLLAATLAAGSPASRLR